MELPTSNRKKVTDIWLTGLVAKTTLFPFFRRSYLGNRSTYTAENFPRIFLGIICECAKFHQNRRGDSQTIGWSDTEWPIMKLIEYFGLIVKKIFYSLTFKHWHDSYFFTSIVVFYSNNRLLYSNVYSLYRREQLFDLYSVLLWCLHYGGMGSSGTGFKLSSFQREASTHNFARWLHLQINCTLVGIICNSNLSIPWKYNRKKVRKHMGNSSVTGVAFAHTIWHLGFSIWNIIFILFFLSMHGVNMMS